MSRFSECFQSAFRVKCKRPDVNSNSPLADYKSTVDTIRKFDSPRARSGLSVATPAHHRASPSCWSRPPSDSPPGRPTGSPSTLQHGCRAVGIPTAVSAWTFSVSAVPLHACHALTCTTAALSTCQGVRRACETFSGIAFMVRCRGRTPTSACEHRGQDEQRGSRARAWPQRPRAART